MTRHVFSSCCYTRSLYGVHGVHDMSRPSELFGIHSILSRVAEGESRQRTSSRLQLVPALVAVAPVGRHTVYCMFSTCTCLELDREGESRLAVGSYWCIGCTSRNACHVVRVITPWTCRLPVPRGRMQRGGTSWKVARAAKQMLMEFASIDLLIKGNLKYPGSIHAMLHGTWPARVVRLGGTA